MGNTPFPVEWAGNGRFPEEESTPVTSEAEMPSTNMASTEVDKH